MGSECFSLNYAKELYQRSLMDGNKELLPFNDFMMVVSSVVDLIHASPDLDIHEYRTKLFEMSGIKEAIKELIDFKKLTPSLVISYGTRNYTETISYGNKSEVPFISPIKKDSILDLASTTKIFTSISILKLVEENIINLSDDVTKYCPSFQNLKGVTIYDLLAFQTPLLTSKRIDAANSKEEAEEILFNIRVNDNFDRLANPYSDMGAMILKYVIESVTGMPYYDYLWAYILMPLGLKDTYCVIPKDKLDRIVHTDYCYKVLDENDVRIRNPKLGFPYDEKACALGSELGYLTGHAGLFSTACDMTTLARSILSSTILSDYSISEMAKNRTGKSYTTIDGSTKTVQHLGYLCYAKNPIQNSSEVLHLLSGSAFASPGWVGNQFVIDPQNGVYSFLGSNRCHNRVVYVNRSIRESIEEKVGQATYIKLPNNERKIDSSFYAWERGEVADRAIILAMQYKVMEDYLNLHEEYMSLERII